YALARGETILGGAVGGGPGIDLSSQEGQGARRMDPRQAVLNWSNDTLTVRDLDSAGGTFVNRQRILPGQARALQVGDTIQLGSVQVRVVSRGGSTNSAPAARPAPAPASRPTAPPPLPSSAP